MLAYIGLRIAQDNPIVGVGWQRSSRPEVFEPYVDDARERFPDVVDLAFPAEGREWGVQNLYIQMLADAGAIGLALSTGGREQRARAGVASCGSCTDTVGRGRGALTVCGLSLSQASGPRSASSPGSAPGGDVPLLGLAAAGAATVEIVARR